MTRVNVVRMDEVMPQPVEWLWPQRIPRHAVTILGGDPEVGKSYLLTDLAARLSRGDGWPDGPAIPRPLKTVWLGAEDDLSRVLAPRLDACGADRRFITAVRSINRPDEAPDAPIMLDRDIEALAAVVHKERPALVVIDPIGSYLGGQTDAFRDNAVRAVLAPVAALAERVGFAVVLVAHTTKDTRRPAVHRLLGSVAFAGIARSVLVVGPDRDDPKRRILAHAKCNLGIRAPSLAYQIRDGVLAWESEPVDVTADQLLGPPESAVEADERSDAQRFLCDLLADGPVAADAVFAAGRKAGFTDKMLRTAGRALGVRHRKVGQPGEPGAHWEWALPDAGPAKIPKMPADRERETSTSSARPGDSDGNRHESTEPGGDPADLIGGGELLDFNVNGDDGRLDCFRN